MKTTIKLVLGVVFAILITAPTTLYISRYLYTQKHELFKGSVLTAMVAFNAVSYQAERSIIEKLPIYSDFTSIEKENKLRSFLYPYHIKIAKDFGFAVATLEQLQKATAAGEFLEVTANQYLYFYGVKKEHRYLRRQAFAALNLVCARFNTMLIDKGITVPVKLAVSSLTRPEKYQTTLTEKNSNAVAESSHSFGVSFDLFFDDYYVTLPDSGEGFSGELIDEVRSRYGFILGDSLRRQLKAVLAATLLELQDEGLIYVILERRQRVFHVTFTEKLNQ